MIEDSNRLSYALMTSADAELLYQLDQDVEVMRYINGGKMTSREDLNQVYLPRLAKYTDPEKGWGMWKVTVSQTNEFIGWILVRPMGFFSNHPQWDNLELGWRFMQKSWGQGYGTEAALQIMNCIGALPNITKFSAIALPDNHASIKIMGKLGMQYVKTAINKDPLGDLEVVYYEVSV
ncbi:GNAT family N-acetyltransferase [Marinicella litoralis]|nr:GNAT family N-acetyltransferase [Marinicella litoralis]